jgi:hypothetical protein
MLKIHHQDLGGMLGRQVQGVDLPFSFGCLPMISLAYPDSRSRRRPRVDESAALPQ